MIKQHNIPVIEKEIANLEHREGYLENINEDGYIQTDSFQETTVPGIYACGDNSNRIRTVADAIATGTTAGITLSKKMIMENFK